MICTSICFTRQIALAVRLHQIVPHAKAHPTISRLLKEESKNVHLPSVFLHYSLPVLFEKTQLCSQPSEIDHVQPMRFEIQGTMRLQATYERKAWFRRTRLPHLWVGVHVQACFGKTHSLPCRYQTILVLAVWLQVQAKTRFETTHTSNAFSSEAKTEST